GIIWYAVKPAISRNTNNSSVARLRSSAARINVSILRLLRFYRIYRIASGYKTRPHGDDFQLIGKTIDPHTGGVKTQNIYRQEFNLLRAVHSFDAQLSIFTEHQ